MNYSTSPERKRRVSCTLDIDWPRSVQSLPRLLISVRNATEALAAVRGGADIIDVKEPSAGSLGMASPEAIAEIVRTVSQVAPNVPCSVALGELLDLNGTKTPCIPVAVRWLKMGLSGCRQHTDWYARWLSARNAMRPHGSWIAVAYVDAEAAYAPPIREVLEAAIETRCAGLLLDTFSKNGGTLLDAVSSHELREITCKARTAGLMIAVAGQLRRCDLPTILAAEPDVIAVRSAVCRDQNRTAVMEESLVREFRAAMVPTASVAAW